MFKANAYATPIRRIEERDTVLQSSINGLQKYLDAPFKEVDGWCTPHLFPAIVASRIHQESLGLTSAPIAEIGVFHGKFLLGLAALAGTQTGHYAIDVFDMQEFNLDGAGKGSLEMLKANAEKAGFSESDFTYFSADSMAINRQQISEISANAPGGFSFFSVDGCHTPEHTVNDARIAMELTDTRGIVFIDDYNNPNWPGVQEGICLLYTSPSPRDS